MKILHFFHTLEIGGAQIIRLNIIEGLLVSNPEIQHLIISFKDGLLFNKAKSLNVEVIVLKNYKLVPRFFYIPKIIKIIKKFNPDIIHSLPWMPNFFCRLVFKKIFPSIRLISDFHGTAHLGLIHKFIDRLTYCYSDDWLFISNEVKNYFHNLWQPSQALSKKFHVISNGVDIKKFLRNTKAREQFRQSQNIKNDVFVFGIAARLDVVKRLSMLIECFEGLVLRTAKKVLLIISGDGPEKVSLSKTILKLRLEGNIKLINLDLDKMPSFYNGIDCFVLCSESEGLPLVLLEAGATGLPILLSENLKSQVSLFCKKAPIFLFNSISSFSEQSEKIILGMDETRHHYIKTEYQICSILKKYAVLYSDAGRR